MKSTIKTLIAAAFAVGLATSASAAPPGKDLFPTRTYKQANTQEQLEGLKKSDRYAMVCMECKSVTVKEVGDKREVEALCHDGGSVHCDACKKKFTIKRVGPPGKGTTSAKFTYVNADGKECMFIVRVND